MSNDFFVTKTQLCSIVPVQCSHLFGNVVAVQHCVKLQALTFCTREKFITFLPKQAIFCFFKTYFLTFLLEIFSRINESFK